MSDSVVINGRQFTNGLDKSVKRFNKMFGRKMRMLVNEAMKRLIDKTPVQTGQAVMNYVASKGTPYGGPILEGPDPVEPTNPLALGSERLRGGAVSIAMGTLKGLDYLQPFDAYWITNRAPHIGGLETGSLPEDPFTPRSPRGMFGVTLQELSALLQSGRL